MEKINRLGWAAGMSFVSYGVRVGIRVTNPEVVERLPDLLPPYWKPVRSPEVERLYSLVVGGSGPNAKIRRFHLLYADAVRVTRTMELEEALQTLESDLQLYVAERARRRLFVHAGVVGWEDRAIVIPGRSRSGKSTLVAALVEAGATYLSDEYAVFDAQGRVHPYPKPLSLRERGVARPRKIQLEAWSGLPGIKSLRVGQVVVAGFRQGARWRPRLLSQGRAVIELLAHTVSAQRRPELALTTLPRVVSDALVLKGARGEAEAMVDELLNNTGELRSGVSSHNCPPRVAQG